MKAMTVLMASAAVAAGVQGQVPQFEMVSPFGDFGRVRGLHLDGVGGVGVAAGFEFTRLRADGTVDVFDLTRGRGNSPVFNTVTDDYVITADVTSATLTRIDLQGRTQAIDPLDPSATLAEPHVSRLGSVVAIEVTPGPGGFFGGVVFRDGQRTQLPGNGVVWPFGFDGADRVLALNGQVGWYEGTTFLPLPPSDSGLVPRASSAAAPNGDAAGADYDSLGRFIGYHYQDGVTHDLVEPSGAEQRRSSTQIRGVTSDGWVVGNVQLDLPSGVFPDLQPTIWVDQQPHSIRDLVVDTFGLTIGNVFEVDDTGQMVVEALGPNGTGGLYLLRPIPTPGTVACVAGLGLLATRRRR